MIQCLNTPNEDKKYRHHEEYLNDDFNTDEFKKYEDHDIESQSLAEFEEDDNLGWSHEIEGIRYYKVRVPADAIEGYDFDQYFTVFINDKNKIQAI